MTDIADETATNLGKSFCKVIDDVLIDSPGAVIVLKIEENHLYRASVSEGRKEQGKTLREALEQIAGTNIIEGSDDLAKIALDRYKSIIFIALEKTYWCHAISYSNGKQEVISQFGVNVEDALRTVVRINNYIKQN